jgi:hypothetical protein
MDNEDLTPSDFIFDIRDTGVLRLIFCFDVSWPREQTLCDLPTL